MSYNKIFILFLIVFIFISCRNSTEPSHLDVVTTTDDLSNFKTILADYDSVVFKNSDDMLLKQKDVKKIIIGEKVDGIFREFDYSRTSEIINTRVKFNTQNRTNIFSGGTETGPKYTEVGDKFRLEFEISMKVDSTIYIQYFTLRFIMIDDTYIEIDALVNFYKHPYEKSEIYLTKEDVEVFAERVQDICVKESKLHFFIGGGGDPGEFNFATKTKKLYPSGGGGDFITANESYAYYNGGPIQILRYNFEQEDVDSRFYITSIDSALNKNLFIAGLAIKDDELYVLLSENETGNPYLVKMELDFSDFIVTDLGVNNTGWPYFLSIYNDIAFSYDYKTFMINRYNLMTNTFLEPILSPTLDLTGMDFYNNRFYYSDWNRIALFSIPVSDLMD